MSMDDGDEHSYQSRENHDGEGPKLMCVDFVKIPDLELPQAGHPRIKHIIDEHLECAANWLQCDSLKSRKSTDHVHGESTDSSPQIRVEQAHATNMRNENNAKALIDHHVENLNQVRRVFKLLQKKLDVSTAKESEEDDNLVASPTPSESEEDDNLLASPTPSNPTVVEQNGGDTLEAPPSRKGDQSVLPEESEDLITEESSKLDRRDDRATMDMEELEERGTTASAEEQEEQEERDNLVDSPPSNPTVVEQNGADTLEAPSSRKGDQPVLPVKGGLQFSAVISVSRLRTANNAGHPYAGRIIKHNSFCAYPNIIKAYREHVEEGASTGALKVEIDGASVTA